MPKRLILHEDTVSAMRMIFCVRDVGWQLWSYLVKVCNLSHLLLLDSFPVPCLSLFSLFGALEENLFDGTFTSIQESWIDRSGSAKIMILIHSFSCNRWWKHVQYHRRVLFVFAREASSLAWQQQDTSGMPPLWPSSRSTAKTTKYPRWWRQGRGHCISGNEPEWDFGCDKSTGTWPTLSFSDPAPHDLTQSQEASHLVLNAQLHSNLLTLHFNPNVSEGSYTIFISRRVQVSGQSRNRRV